MTIQANALDAHRRLAAVIADLTDEQVAQPSVLPGWTRGHVLAHLANGTAGLAGQAEHEGTKVEVYPGGRPARDAAIEAAAGRTAAEHRAAIADAVDRLTKAWANVRDWDTPVFYRDGTLTDTAYAVWREVEIHTRDLDLGPVTWSLEFCDHVVDFLSVRVPDDVRLTLRSPRRQWTIGEGRDVELTGSHTDLTAWLAGRAPHGPVDGQQPELKPWP
ncbi:maleylpyruvate isomerase family mycothiol-dependent enzyme [Saccharothrix sp. S26]|uniref:maleylpyruvate isomerase family mycothiol-dependent enzyme n=1 Tax=Saccharothrix sp. S26 TaxID=2907215 RepID=UPI001F24BBC6|nr:maleylpyruvate isomerase family mycothiol-dependent enzyme [Saccharothrix sp. S26]MCE6997612.1 maleylpyruvate isomerase family mycothiol-dependent enzyme [Saccharothrix sp. S26]